MSKQKFKEGDRVICTKFYYKDRSHLSGKIGIFIKYSIPYSGPCSGGDEVALVTYGNCEGVFCLIPYTTKIDNEQLLFDFMYKD